MDATAVKMIDAEAGRVFTLLYCRLIKPVDHKYSQYGTFDRVYIMA